jgi:hypothetical protein
VPPPLANKSLPLPAMMERCADKRLAKRRLDLRCSILGVVGKVVLVLVAAAASGVG